MALLASARAIPSRSSSRDVKNDFRAKRLGPLALGRGASDGITITDGMPRSFAAGDACADCPTKRHHAARLASAGMDESLL